MTNNTFLCFYSVFVGSILNKANAIPPLPSRMYDCLFFTNNPFVQKRAIEKGWKTVLLNISVKDDTYDSNMQAKRIKVLPHLLPELSKYEYTCYIDSKLKRINEALVLKLIREKLNSKVTMLLRKHWFIQGSIWNEFTASIEQPRYKSEEGKYRSYISHQIDSGLKENHGIHLAGGFIIRKNCPSQSEIDNTWYAHILECGIQDQISLYFVRQLFEESIQSFDTDPFILK